METVITILAIWGAIDIIVSGVLLIHPEVRRQARLGFGTLRSILSGE